MLLLKYLFFIAGFALIAGAIAIVLFDVLAAIQYRRLFAAGSGMTTIRPHAVLLRLATRKPRPRSLMV
jgi:hypothetical protein